MQSRYPNNALAAATADDGDLAAEVELNLLRDIFRMLPAGVTLQDEQGHFLLMNDTAAAQFGSTAAEAATLPSNVLHRRRETGLELLRAGRPATTEESVTGAHGKQVLLTAYRPVRIA